MSDYGAYGLARHGRGYRAILGHYYRHTQIGAPPATRSGFCSGRARLGQVQEGEQGLRQAAPPRTTATGSSARARGSRCSAPGGRRIARCGRAGDGRRQGRDPDPRQGHLPRAVAGQGVGRRAAGDQRGRPRRIRDGRRAERDAALVAAAGASSPGGGGALDRAGQQRRRVLRRLRRHPQPGLRRQGHRDAEHQQGVPGARSARSCATTGRSPRPSSSRPPAVAPRASSTASPAPARSAI